MNYVEKAKGIVEKTPNWCIKKISNCNGRDFVRLSREDALKCNLLIGYYESNSIFVAWNGAIHGGNIVSGQTHDFTIKHFNVKKISEHDVVVPCYKHFQGAQRTEKVVLIKPEYILEFLKNPFSYLMPAPDDNGYDPDCLFALQNKDAEKTIKEFEEENRLWVVKERKYHSCKVANRNAEFRSRVFSKYEHPHCVVCNNDCEIVLEAAHIIAVKDGGSDDPKNGVCLCANHHLLFDSGLFTIDSTTNVISDVDPSVESYLRYS